MTTDLTQITPLELAFLFVEHGGAYNCEVLTTVFDNNGGPMIDWSSVGSWEDAYLHPLSYIWYAYGVRRKVPRDPDPTA